MSDLTDRDHGDEDDGALSRACYVALFATHHLVGVKDADLAGRAAPAHHRLDPETLVWLPPAYVEPEVCGVH